MFLSLFVFFRTFPNLKMIWGFPKMVVPPNHPILIGFSITFGGSPTFGNTHMLQETKILPVHQPTIRWTHVPTFATWVYPIEDQQKSCQPVLPRNEKRPAKLEKPLFKHEPPRIKHTYLPPKKKYPWPCH